MIWIWCELTADVACVQKRLIEKSEEAVDKDLLIHHKEKLYVELKNILARQVHFPNLATAFLIWQLVRRAQEHSRAPGAPS